MHVHVYLIECKILFMRIINILVNKYNIHISRHVKLLIISVFLANTSPFNNFRPQLFFPASTRGKKIIKFMTTLSVNKTLRTYLFVDCLYYKHTYVYTTYTTSPPKLNFLLIFFIYRHASWYFINVERIFMKRLFDNILGWGP